MKRRSSSIRGRRGARAASTGLRVVRYLVAAVCFLLLSGLLAASLRFPLPERPAQWVRYLPERARGLAEFGPLPEAARKQMRASLAESDSDVTPVDHLLDALSVDVASTRAPGTRADEAAALLARAKSPVTVEASTLDRRTMVLTERLSAATEATLTRRGLVVLPGERLRLVLPLDRKETYRAGLRVRCLGATADRLDAPAKGLIAQGLPGGMPEERAVDLSARGQPTWIDVEGRAGTEITLTWPDQAPGFLLVEGWRRGSLEREGLAASKRGLLLFSVDGLPRGEDGEPSLPKTFRALESVYGNGNVARFSRVMPSSTVADEALSGLLTGRGAASAPLDPAAPSGLFVSAARAGLPSTFTRIESAREEPHGLAPGVGEPFSTLTLPRRSEIGGAIGDALTNQPWDAARFAAVRILFPAAALAPTWRSALGMPAARIPLHMAAGVGRALGLATPEELAWSEKRRQIDDALARAILATGVQRNNDFALAVLEGRTESQADGSPVPPPAGHVWFASRAWNGAAPESDSLASLQDLNAGLARHLEGSSASVASLAEVASRSAPHTVTSTERGVWHLFPFGKVLLPARASHNLFARAEEAPYVWDVPLDKTRETQTALSEPKSSRKEHALHVFFPPGKARERVSASLLWNLEPKRCGVSEPGGNQATGSGTQARGVVEKDKEKGGWRLWFTGVSDEETGFHAVCAFTGEPRGASPVEMHFERGSQSLPLASVGLGEFALPLPALEEGVQLAQTRYDEFKPLLTAGFAPSWKALVGYRLLMWEDPNPGAALEGLAEVDLQRRDKEPVPGSAEAGSGEAIPPGIRSEAQRRRFAGEGP